MTNIIFMPKESETPAGVTLNIFTARGTRLSNGVASGNELYVIDEVFKSSELPAEGAFGFPLFEVGSNAVAGMLYNKTTNEALSMNDALLTWFTEEHVMGLVRYNRDRTLMQTDSLVTRHRDQLDNSETTTLSAAEYTELLNYRKALRDFPANVDLNVASFDAIVWPTKPSFL